MQKLFLQFKRIFIYLITAILVFIPLYIKFPLFRIPGTYVSIRMEDFLVGVTTIYLLIFHYKDILEVLKTRIGKAVLLFWFAGLVSFLSAYLVTQTVSPALGFLHLLRRVEYMTLFFAGFIYIKTSTDRSKFDYVVKLLLLINLFVFLYGLGQRYLSFPVIVTQNEEYSKGIALRWINGAHINSTFAGHYDLASYLLLVTPVFITLFFLIKNKLQKIILSLSIAMSYWLLAAAASRISIVSFALALAVSMMLIKRYKELVLMLVISFFVFGLSPELKARYLRIFEVVKEKITYVGAVYAQANPTQGAEVFEDRSTSIRLNVEWPRALRALTKNPLLGTGYSSINLATDNDYLRSLGETGILGFAALALVFINIAKLIAKSIGRIESLNVIDKSFIVGFIGGIVGAFSNAMFIDVFEASKFATIFWLFMGFVVSSLILNIYEQTN